MSFVFNEIKADVENKTVTFDNQVFTKFKMLDRVSDVYALLKFYDTVKLSNGHRSQARAFSDKYCITPKKFIKVFNAKMMSIWVDPIKEHVNRFAYNSRKKINYWSVDCIWESISEIEQAKKDGIYNIVPWIIAEGKSPKELKDHFGKGVWKKLCSQSMTRNKLIAKGAKRFRYPSEETITTALNLPSYILKRGGNTNLLWDDSTKYLVEQGLIKSKHMNRGASQRDQQRLRQIYSDTKRMSEQLGRVFNHSWDPVKLQEKHEEYTKLVMLKRYSPEPYEHLKEFEHKVVHNESYTATLLDSAALIYEEGQAMHHCVGMYSNNVAQGNYLVYSITKNGERSSTIAFRLNYDPSGLSTHKEWMFNQHYGSCNKHVDEPDEKAFEGILLKLLNHKDKLNK